MSRQFDVFRSPSAELRKLFPFLIILQHDSLSSTASVVVAPLVPEDWLPPSRVYPMLDLLDGKSIMLTPDLAVVPRRVLKRPIENLDRQRSLIVAAIDMLFVGS